MIRTGSGTLLNMAAILDLNSRQNLCVERDTRILLYLESTTLHFLVVTVIVYLISVCMHSKWSIVIL